MPVWVSPKKNFFDCRAQELSSELQIAEAPAVEVVPNALAANATVANAAGTNNVGGAGGGSLFGNAGEFEREIFAIFAKMHGLS
jgi:hypothetical protein